MTSISRSEHEKMQAALEGLHTENALNMKRELAVMHEQFIANLEAARQSVMVYEKQYKAARALLTKAVKAKKQEVVRKLGHGAIHMILLVFLFNY